MAAKKAVARKGSKEVTRKPRSEAELSSLEKKLMERIKSAQEEIKGDGSNLIRFDSRGFVYQGAELGMSLDVVVLGSCFEKTYYDAPFDREASTAVDPLCWALGEDSKNLSPKASLKTKLSDACRTCSMSEWIDGRKAKDEIGNQCRDYRRVAVVPWLEDQAAPDLSEIALIRIPPTSLKNFATYITRVYRFLGQDPIQLVTRFEIDQTESYGKIQIPSIVETIEDRETVADLQALPAEAVLADVPYSLTPTPAPAPPQRKKRARSRV